MLTVPASHSSNLWLKMWENHSAYKILWYHIGASAVFMLPFWASCPVYSLADTVCPFQWQWQEVVDMKYDYVCAWKNSGIFCLENVHFLNENEKKAQLRIIEIILEF